MSYDSAVVDRRSLDFTWFGELALAFVAGYFVGALVLVSVPVVALGWRPTVVTSGSMSPAIRAGDVVLVDPHPVDVGPGAVIQFRDPAGGLMLHRVVELDGSGFIYTRGDANGEVDRSPVALDAVVGRGVMMLPALFHPLSGGILALVGFIGLGRLGGVLRSPSGHRWLVSAGVVVLAVVSLSIPATRAAFAATTATGASSAAGATLAAPTSFDASCNLVTVGDVDLSWTASSTGGVTHYDVLYGLDEPPSTVVATVPASETTYTHTVVSLVGTHNYAVRARVGNWVSPLSNSDSVQISLLLVCTD